MNPLLDPNFLLKLTRCYLFDINRIYRSSAEEIKKFQDKSIRKIVKYAYNVPLYSRKYRKAGVYSDDIKGVKDIKKLPFITKQDLRGASLEALRPPGSNEKKYSPVSTSGSTGKPVTLYSEPYTVFQTFIGFIRMIREHNINWRKTRMAIIADLSPDSAEYVYFLKTALPNLKLFFSFENIKVFNVSENSEKLTEKIEMFNPEFLGGYPGIIKIMSVLKKHGKTPKLSPRIIATSGSVVDDYTRQYIKNAFDAELFDAYGATECSPMAFQCRMEKYHVNSDFVHMEFMDPKEKETISGDGGNIVVTRLFGRGTPIIRYTGINDFVFPSNETCDCGINTMIIERIGGRRADSIILPNGEIIPPSSFTGIPHKVMYKFNTEKIQQFQIIQHSLTEIDILIVIDDKLRDVGPKVDEIFKEIKNQYERKIGQGVLITVREVDKIELNRPGSTTPPPVVISKLEIDL